VGINFKRAAAVTPRRGGQLKPRRVIDRNGGDTDVVQSRLRLPGFRLKCLRAKATGRRLMRYFREIVDLRRHADADSP
jgi:hypothetical protein